MSLDGLRNLSDEPEDTAAGSSGSSSSYPKVQHRVPFIVIYTDEEGNYKSAKQPQDRDLQLEYVKQDSSSSYELQRVPEYFERHWLDRNSFRRARHIVDDVLGKDLLDLIDDDPEAAVTAVIESAKVYKTDREISKTESCPVCRTELHVIYDDYDTVNNRRVCSDHTLGEITESGLLDQKGIPRNRLWE